MSSILDPEQTFAKLAGEVGLDVRLKKSLARLGFARPTLVQSKCLPLVVSEGRDVLVRARTGSGKTLAYCLPVLQKIIQTKSKSSSNNDTVAALILVPTRELCSQVQSVLEDLVYYLDDIIIAVLSAGKRNPQELQRQEATLRDRPSIVVATPSAVLLHLRNEKLHLKQIETLVVDEADLVLSFGHSKDLNEIVKYLPRIYQGLMLSATLSPELDSFKKVVLHSPVVLKLEQEKESESGNLKQFFVALPKKDKFLLLYVFLKLGVLKGKGLFFVNSTDAGYRLKLCLEQFHIRSAVLNAELPFRSRLNIIEQFNIGNFDYLIATDFSTDATNEESSDDDKNHKEKVPKNKMQDADYGVSRGLDFRNVSFVVNVDLAVNPRAYAHRIGRTARGGAKGVALSLVEIDNKEQLNMLLEIQDSQPRIPLNNASSDNMRAVPTETEDGTQDQPQPVPLDFDLHEIEGFRYRVEDVSRAVTKTAVRETRAAELKAEMLNSERLQAHFEDNPLDLQILAHDRVATHVSQVQDHLKHVPKYLLPRGMQVANLNRRRKKRKIRGSRSGLRRSDNDPLQTFDGDVNLDGVAQESEELAEFFQDDDDEGKTSKATEQSTEPKILANTRDGTGRSTSGRKAWKARHSKGEFSNKRRKSDRKYMQPLGI